MKSVSVVRQKKVTGGGLEQLAKDGQETVLSSSPTPDGIFALFWNRKHEED